MTWLQVLCWRRLQLRAGPPAVRLLTRALAGAVAQGRFSFVVDVLTPALSFMLDHKVSCGKLR